MVRRIAVGLLLLLSITLSIANVGCGTNLPDGAIAQVGQGVVTKEEFEAFVSSYEDAGKAPDEGKQPDEYKLFKQRCAEYLVILQVLYQMGPEFDVAVTAEDIEAGVNRIRTMFLGDQAKFDAAVAAQGMTLEQLRLGVEQSVWLERMQDAVTSKVTIKESEVKDSYDQHKSEYILAEAREVRHILISPFLDSAGNMITETPSESDWEAAEAEAAKVRSEIMNGANFVTMVENYSDDPSSKDTEGTLGEIVQGQTAPAFEQAVFQLSKEEISQPVRTPSGYSIIQVMDITPAQQLAYDSVKEQIRSNLLEEKRTQAWKDWLTETMTALGVVYADGYAPPDAVTAPLPEAVVPGQSDTTAPAEGGQETTSTAAGEQ